MLNFLDKCLFECTPTEAADDVENSQMTQKSDEIESCWRNTKKQAAFEEY